MECAIQYMNEHRFLFKNKPIILCLLEYLLVKIAN